MITTIEIFGRVIPVYGLCIVAGLLVGSCFVVILNRKHKGLMEDSLIIYAYGGGFAMLGAKILYLITIYEYIDWSRILELEYINLLMQGGLVFYGGLIGGVFGAALACKVHKLDWRKQLPICITVIPFGHAFGRLGCTLVGCCYGMPYDGPFAITYTASHFAPNNISLFPSQPVEVVFDLILFAILFTLSIRKLDLTRSVVIYFISYSCYRFIIEFFRYDTERGIWMGLSTSQWISIAVFLATIVYIFANKRKCVRE